MTGDLHCHTTLSDSSLGIEEVIVQAKRMGLDFLAITDHDTLSSSNRAQILGERYGVKHKVYVRIFTGNKTFTVWICKKLVVHRAVKLCCIAVIH